MFITDAACHGADPTLFNAIHGERVLDALSYCERCPVTVECDTIVKPKKSYFDGVCGGKIWREGREIHLSLFEYEGD